MMRDLATQRQVDAANPVQSTWLSANAGSGKTRVLTDRVARLLLQGADPQNILCLTYTKAAASEMQNRLFRRLGDWAMMPDDTLRAELRKLGYDADVAPAQLATARTLFALAIETPGGLKIQTIHSFCAGVLRRFPREAQVSPQFTEMDDRTGELLRAEVVDAMLMGPHADSVHAVMAQYTGFEFDKLTKAVVQKRALFAGPMDASAINLALDLPETAHPDDALAIAFPAGSHDLAQGLADRFAPLKVATYKSLTQDLRSLNFESPGKPEWDFVTKHFFDSKDVPKFEKFPQRRHTNAVEAVADLSDEIEAWIAAVVAARDFLNNFDIAARSRALADFGHHFVAAVEARKLALGLLDFDDLIDKTRALLLDRDVAQWVLFRLDGGIDHLLVDEAQDTSPTQWDVIRLLTQEFAAGYGARLNQPRTIFVVGDKKQSIYSFQGADPDAFDEMREHFSRTLSQIDQKVVPERLEHSFRSAEAVLRVVDQTFAGDRGVGLDIDMRHLAFKDQMPGRVDLWPPITVEKQDEDFSWSTPLDRRGSHSAQVQLAERIASQIAHMIAHETIPTEQGENGTYGCRPVRAGDFLILVQRRADLFGQIIRACKRAGLPIAGADRLKIDSVLAVKDILSVLRFLALPEDDLALAEALRSPLFDLTEQDLFTLAHHRPTGGYLWPALRDASAHVGAKDVMQDMMDQADFLRPYDLINRILIRHDGRRKLLARMGAEAEDAIDALLNQALAYESTTVPSLTGFLNWMETDEIEIKRQLDNQSDQIRVMTIHGAKGLEAPIVILPETAERKPPSIGDIINKNGQPIWMPSVTSQSQTVQGASRAQQEKLEKERMRLLYVAMTRAEKWLIVGAAGKTPEGEASWYGMIADGMGHGPVTDAQIGGLEIKRVQSGNWDMALDEPAPMPTSMETEPLQFKPIEKIVRAKPMAPSGLGGAKILPGDLDATANPDAAMARGTLLHRLLEHLPQMEPARRIDLGRAIVAGNDDVIGANDLVAEAIAILENSALSFVFGSNSLAEVPISAALAALGGARINGSIDRLVVSDTDVLAIDFKSNRAVPATPDQTPESILRQLGAYQAALVEIYPNHQIRTAVLWTATAELMIIPPELAIAALNRVTAP